jgi:hypothetical protein
MQLRLTDPSYADRLANFLQSLGQTAVVAAPGRVDVELSTDADALAELGIYLSVWAVLYPEAEVRPENGDDLPPAA